MKENTQIKRPPKWNQEDFVPMLCVCVLFEFVWFCHIYCLYLWCVFRSMVLIVGYGMFFFYFFDWCIWNKYQLLSSKKLLASAAAVNYWIYRFMPFFSLFRFILVLVYCAIFVELFNIKWKRARERKKRMKKLIVVDFSTQPWTKANKDRWVRARVRLINPQIPLCICTHTRCMCECERTCVCVCVMELPVGIKSTPKANYYSIHTARHGTVKWALAALYCGNGQSTTHSL